MRASTACTLPTCLCSSPERDRMNTSNNGHSLRTWVTAISSRCFGGACVLLRRVRQRGFAHPLPCLMSAAASLKALAIAGTVTLENSLKLAPIDGAKTVVPALLIPPQIRVRHSDAEKI